MSENAEDPLLSAAVRISDGVQVDWNEVREQVSTPEQAAIVDELQSLERFAQVAQSVPSTWGRLTVIEEIGRGTFGTVYRAVDPNLQVEVALKIIRSSDPSVPLDPEKALQEARRLVRIRHANVVRVYGAECIGSEVGLWMELITGRTLDDIVRHQAPFGANEAVVIGLDLCRALASVHNADLLHGDIKAHNVMREAGGRTVLMDFGTGRDLRLTPPAPGGDFAGTPLYLAPEVFAGGSRTPASDIYSLGVLLYFLVTGTYPVEGDSRSEIGRQHDVRSARRPLRDVRPDLPDAFIYVVEQATAERPEDRFTSAGALEAALAQVLSPRPSEAEGGQSAPTVGNTADHTRRSRPYWIRRVLVPVAVVLALGVGAVVGSLMRRERASTTGDKFVVAAADPIVADRETPSPPPDPTDYQIEAAFYRERDGSIERLAPDATVAPSDKLSLQVRVSVPAYVYVVNEDEQGRSYLLFPLPGQALPNPLPPSQRHRLPGMFNGEAFSWQVTTAGRKEHFLIVATPERSPAFEELFATLPHPRVGEPPISATLSEDALGVLRSVGRLAPSPVKHRQLRLMPEFSTPLAAGEEIARGVWIRQATFANPIGSGS